MTEKIRWGVLGTADIAHGCFIPGLQLADNAELYAIAGRNLEKAKKFQKEFGFEKAYGSYDELLNDSLVDAVYVPLPNHLHAEWAMKAMKKGKHVMCEKPLALSREQAKEMFEKIGKNYGIVLEEWNHDIDHVHIMFRAQPRTEISKFINAYKSASSRLIKKDFPEVRHKLWKEMFWSRSYCLLTTGGAPIEIIRKYIENQGR